MRVFKIQDNKGFYLLDEAYWDDPDESPWLSGKWGNVHAHCFLSKDEAMKCIEENAFLKQKAEQLTLVRDTW